MRRGLPFILVMLLVLRGLLGDAMAMGIAPVALPAAAIHCPMAAAEAAATDCDHVTGPTCSACDICHSVLFTLDLLAQPLPLQPSALRPLGCTRFASASAALAIKPPIS